VEESIKNRFLDSLRSLGMTMVDVISTAAMPRFVHLSRHFDRSDAQHRAAEKSI
jgi:hypothetical protein